jgi:hypothetical protein
MINVMFRLNPNLHQDIIQFIGVRGNSGRNNYAGILFFMETFLQKSTFDPGLYLPRYDGVEGDISVRLRINEKRFPMLCDSLREAPWGTKGVFFYNVLIETHQRWKADPDYFKPEGLQKAVTNTNETGFSSPLTVKEAPSQAKEDWSGVSMDLGDFDSEA